MIKIAICDDKEDAVALHEKIVRNSLHQCGISYDITTYTVSKNLLYDIIEDGLT